MGYATIEDVRLLTNLSTTDISDAILSGILEKTISEINSKISVLITRERIQYIDSTRQNKIDGSNTTYYIQNWEGKYIADRNDDAVVGPADVTVYQVAPGGVETELTVSSVDSDDGKIVLSSAPASGVKLYITYAYTKLNPNTPEGLLVLAHAWLVASYVYLRRDTGTANNVRFGRTSISRKVSEGHTMAYNKYMMVLREINNVNIGGGSWIESKVKI